MVPVSVVVPVPSLVSAVVLVPSWMTPLNVVLVLLPPSLSVALAATPLLVTVPAPASDAIVWLKPPRSRNAPEATVTALLALKVLVAPPRSVPAEIVVAPL